MSVAVSFNYLRQIFRTTKGAMSAAVGKYALPLELPDLFSASPELEGSPIERMAIANQILRSPERLGER